MENAETDSTFTAAAVLKGRKIVYFSILIIFLNILLTVIYRTISPEMHDGSLKSTGIIQLTIILLNAYLNYKGYRWAQILYAIQAILLGVFMMLMAFGTFGEFNLFFQTLFYGQGALLALSAILITFFPNEVKAYNWYIKKKKEMAGIKAVEELEDHQQ